MDDITSNDLLLQQITDSLNLTPLEMVSLKHFYDWFIKPPKNIEKKNAEKTNHVRRKLGLSNE